jgi:pyrimidine-nucleoside phosphorylase
VDLRPLIALKRDGGTLTGAQIETFVRAAAGGEAPEVQLASMLMAIFTRGLDTRERTDYALAMMRSGDILAWDHLDRPTVDKHSTGGVGDKVSLIWGPLMAAVGFAVPMISGRGLGHTGGTLDKLEAIPGFRTDLSAQEMDRAVQRAGCVITGQTADLVPADRTLYTLRSQTATVPTLDHIAPSIMSKKLAEACETLVLDVKVGSGAFMKDAASALELAEVMIAIGRGAGCRIAALLTDMSAPLGRSVGNALEVQESLDVLRGDGPADVRSLVLDLAATAVRASGRSAMLDGPVDEALAAALDSGAALRSFEAMVEAQGGDPKALRPGGLVGEAGIREEIVPAPTDGVVHGIDALQIGLAAAALGGARGGDGSAPDPGVGVILSVGIGDPVRRGDPCLRLLHRDGRGVDRARSLAKEALRIGPDAAERVPLILKRLGDHR